MSSFVQDGRTSMSQYLLSVPHNSDEEPTMDTMAPSSAITVDNTGESLSTVNGPFVEAPEYLGGFWVIGVADEEAALGWAARASKALGGRIEVRAFQVPPGE